MLGHDARSTLCVISIRRGQSTSILTPLFCRKSSAIKMFRSQQTFIIDGDTIVDAVTNSLLTKKKQKIKALKPLRFQGFLESFRLAYCARLPYLFHCFHPLISPRRSRCGPKSMRRVPPRMRCCKKRIFLPILLSYSALLKTIKDFSAFKEKDFQLYNIILYFFKRDGV